MLYVDDGIREFTLWFDIVIRYSVQGKQVHDARLVATMLTHEVRHLLTFNTQDFQRYADLIVLLDAATL